MDAAVLKLLSPIDILEYHMSVIQNMPLFHSITATEHAVRDLNDEWSRQAEELVAKLRKWLNGSRCILIFRTNDSFFHDLYPRKIAWSFFIRGHETLVLEPEEVTLDLLSVAYHSEPQYYLKTNAPAESLQSLLEGCLKGNSEDVWRDGEFDELALHREFGDFIMVFYGWSQHRLAGEKDIIVLNDEAKAWLRPERKKTLWRKMMHSLKMYYRKRRQE